MHCDFLFYIMFIFIERNMHIILMVVRLTVKCNVVLKKGSRIITVRYSPHNLEYIIVVCSLRQSFFVRQCVVIILA